MIKVIIVGSKGRMGQALIKCIPQHEGLKLAASIGRSDNLAGALADGDVVIDFSSPENSVAVARLCASHAKPLVIGATGHTARETVEIQELKSKIPLVLASNFSTGVNTLFWLTRKATEILGADFDLEVIEMHHRLKKESPSGTAKTLAEIMAEVRQQKLADVVRHGREGMLGARTASEIGMHSLRGGDVVGEHTVVFATPGERVELTHKASSRDTFANGALRAARWVVKQKPGLYNMQDVLGLK